MNAPRVVIVEDDLQIRRFVRDAVAKAGCTAIEAGTGQQGLAAIAAEETQLLILDLGLPDMNGVDLIRELRHWSALPILILSARTTERDKVEALDAGADDYLTKPFGLGELLARMRVLLRRHGSDATASPLFQFADIEVDLAHHSVRRGDTEIKLTQLEFRLLATFVSNAGKVMTQRTLMNEVWGPGHVGQEHYLRIYVRRLRQKIEQNPIQPRHLLTEIGVGYRFQP
ncbi:MAG: response regulator [Rhodocyclaceae bacterium]|nr:response regulator [Rhodocyclaceae bacterium]MDZ4214298.1 response regulator [Rhodocyclaceae bacterium]